MRDSIVYNIPATMLAAYLERRIIVRSHDPTELVKRLAHHDLEKIAYLQLLDSSGNMDELLRWEPPIPMDLVIQDPKAELPLLYRYAPVLIDRPVRVSIPVVGGFSKIAKLALSLNFAVKLELNQPESSQIEELLHVADLYLHQSTVSQPVEYLHSVFLTFYHGDPVTLWSVLEEDASGNRYITDKGEETISKRFVGVDLKHDLTSFLGAFTRELLEEERECCNCRFFEVCRGYFKWPRKEYRCEGIKTIFQTLWDVAEELRADLSAFHPPQRASQS